jgi:hypothetical protein
MVAGCIRARLLNARYRGVYVHGTVKKVRSYGVVARERSASRTGELISSSSIWWPVPTMKRRRLIDRVRR